MKKTNRDMITEQMEGHQKLIDNAEEGLDTSFWQGMIFVSKYYLDNLTNLDDIAFDMDIEVDFTSRYDKVEE